MPRKLKYTAFKLASIKVQEKKLKPYGCHKVLGWAWTDDNFIEIEKYQPPKEYLDTLIHEMLHCFFPKLKEEHVERMATEMTNQIWKRKYRRTKKIL